jgi:hypothetical protein
MHDTTFPSATACVAGAVIRGSWWGHAKGKLIFEVLTRLEDDAAWVKLVLRKETLVHRRLWPALLAAAESGQPWQSVGLKADAERLLRRIDAAGAPVQAPDAAVATELERRLLARSYTEHTASGRHVRFLETWRAWGRRNGLGGKGTKLPDAVDAIATLSAPVMAWAREVGRQPPGLLPWLAAR